MSLEMTWRLFLYQRDRDYFDTLKVGLLDGSVEGSTLARLKVAAEGLGEQTGDPGLDSVLGEIDLRVAVELAKAGIR